MSIIEPEALSAEARPLRKDAERNRRRILDAAATVFAEHGLGASLDDIAHEAEVGIGTVYRRFPNKELLIDALFDDQISAIVALAETGLEHEDAWEGLEFFVRSALERQAANRGLKELILGARMSAGTGCTAEGRVRIEPLVTRLVERAQAAGALRDDIDTTDMPLIQMMIGAVVDYTRNVDPEVWRRLLVVVFDGLRAPASARTPMPTGPLDSDGLLTAMSGWNPPR